jgi:hypothetical protein
VFEIRKITDSSQQPRQLKKYGSFVEKYILNANTPCVTLNLGQKVLSLDVRQPASKLNLQLWTCSVSVMQAKTVMMPVSLNFRYCVVRACYK